MFTRTHTHKHTNTHTQTHTFFLLENRRQQPNSIAASPLKSASEDNRKIMMNVGDVRKFKFDENNKKCNLRDKKEFLVKKEANTDIFYKKLDYNYVAYLDEIFSDKLGFALCGKSELKQVKTFDIARRCGVGTLVSYFCLIDPYVNDPKKKEPNSKAKTYVDIEDVF